MKSVKIIIIALYTLIVVCIGIATVIEKCQGTAFASEHIYGAWWFSALWAGLTVTACAYMMQQQLYKRFSLLLLHVSFVVILAGALTTHLFARRGTVRLRTGVTETTFVDKDGKVEHLPFSLTLKEFRIVNYPGTNAPLDYQSVIRSLTPDSLTPGLSLNSLTPNPSLRERGVYTSAAEPSADKSLTPDPSLRERGVYSSAAEPSADKSLTPGPSLRERGVYSSAAEPSEAVISMNNIANIDGYRLFQQSYDSDGNGVTLGISYDPYGIALTYLGYLMLLSGIIATLFSRGTQMRALYRKAVTAALLFVSVSVSADEKLPVVDKDIAHRMGTISVLYNNRICPLNTVATDFVMKMTGSATWKGYSADEVFFSWMIYYMPWERALAPGSLTPDPSHGGEGSIYSQGKKADERRAIVEMFYSGQFTKIFPYILPRESLTPDPSSLTPNPSLNSLTPDPSLKERGVDSSAAETSADKGNHSPLLERGAGGEASGGEALWFSPGSQVLPREIPVKEQFFIKQSMDFLTESIVTGQRDRAFEIIAKIKLFQREMVGDLLPSESKTQAEIFYNSLRSQKWPVFLALTLSLLLCVALLIRGQRIAQVSLVFSLLLFAYVTLLLSLRWWLSGHIPLSNGHETMLFMAWVLLLLAILLRRKFSVLLGFGPLMASFCLLVSVMAGSSSQLTPLMPVLQSPLLSIHVMTVMCAYALFALQMLMGIQALFTLHSSLERLTAFSQFLLYPAVFLLTIGIFLGAVWANVSWGNYWSWDPKESWALITLMVYALPLHKASVGVFRNPRFYHVYMVASFLVVIITYFGVNFLLGGMHSYASTATDL
jgi:ABC-type transport system involved in cytochrome c biogenesis permease subunit